MRTLNSVFRCVGLVIGSARTRAIAPRCTCLLTDSWSGVSHFNFMATSDLAGGQASRSSDPDFKENDREFSTTSRAGVGSGGGGHGSHNSAAGGGESSNMPYIVGHDKENKMFYIEMGSASGGEREVDRAVLEYEWLRPGLVNLYHTEVPPAFRGKGVAKLLAQAALDHFSGQDKVKMRLTCTYLVKFIQDNPLPRYTASLEA